MGVNSLCEGREYEILGKEIDGVRKRERHGTMKEGREGDARE